MTTPAPHAPLLTCLALLLLAPLPTLGQPPVTTRARISDGGDEARKASASWQRRPGPKRLVVDQVCLVPDFATFLEAIATWDERHYYPILIDDIELTFKFLRAFQPARIVRYPRRVAAVPPDQVWTHAVAAVGRAWSAERGEDAAPLAGDAVPKSLGATPPGAVLAEPDSPMLAGAIALAAGRFQPLLRWDVEKRYQDLLSNAEAQELAASLEAKVASSIPSHSQLGDDCDFVTLAGDWPYRYTPLQDKVGPSAVDDLLGRSANGRSRWAYSGRLVGGASDSVYRAMCSLFLQPKSALLLNTYDEKDKSWGVYAMRTASRRLARLLRVSHRADSRANLAGWHQAFDPINRFDLVMINSHGEPTRFGLTSDTGLAGDVPQSEPAAVLMIHSFSAADPTDPNTIAGRWLANGAFLYFGSMHEPYLTAFRPPDTVASLIEDGIPWGAAMRRPTSEPFGQPWKLVYLGDPLYRLQTATQPARLAAKDWPTGASWPRYDQLPQPGPEATDDARLNWVAKAAVARLQRAPGGPDGAREGLDTVLTSIRRSGLDPALRPYFDALLSDAMLQANRAGELRTQLAAIPPADRSPAVTRVLETCQFLLLEHHLRRREFAQAERIWSDLIRTELPRDVLEQVTKRMGVVADSPSHRATWRAMLLAAQHRLKNRPAEAVIEAERTRVEQMR